MCPDPIVGQGFDQQYVRALASECNGNARCGASPNPATKHKSQERRFAPYYAGRIRLEPFDSRTLLDGIAIPEFPKSTLLVHKL